MRRLPLVMLAVGGCGGTISTSSSIHDDLNDQSALASCATGDVAANLAIVSELRESYHEMIVCGGLALNFDSAITNVLLNAATGHSQASSLVYRGNGTYETPNHMMMLRTSLTGGNGIGFDVLDPQSYLAGITVGVNASGLVNTVARGGSPWQMLGHAAADIELQFQGQGPGFALLDLTAADTRGGHLKISPKRIAQALASHISIADRIDVENQYGATTVHYLIDGAPQPLTQAISDNSVPMTLTSIQATETTTGQTIKITEWTMASKGDGGKTLDGTIGLEVDGRAFPYHVTFTHPIAWIRTSSSAVAGKPGRGPSPAPE